MKTLLPRTNALISRCMRTSRLLISVALIVSACRIQAQFDPEPYPLDGVILYAPDGLQTMGITKVREYGLIGTGVRVTHGEPYYQRPPSGGGCGPGGTCFEVDPVGVGYPPQPTPNPSGLFTWIGEYGTPQTHFPNDVGIASEHARLVGVVSMAA